MNQKEKRFKNGSYSMLISMAVILVAVILNLIAGSLSSDIMQKDFSSEKLYTLTETTEKLVAGLTQSVEIYFICESGEEDDYIEKLLERYADGGSSIRVSQVDPAVYPAFASQYTDKTVENNSVIVVSGGRSKVISAEDMYINGYSTVTQSLVKVGFDAEGMITSAIHYVTTDQVPVLYMLNVNGEISLPQAYTEVLDKENIELKMLNLVSADAVPADAAGIILAAPAKDYSAEQTAKIISYLEKGGKALVYSNYSAEPLYNFESILENYGLKKDPGIILEGNSDRYVEYQYSILPDVFYSEITAELYGDTYVIEPMCQPILETDSFRSSIEHTPLLQATGSAYAKEDVQHMNTSEKVQGDIDGPFVTGMLITEDTNTDKVIDTEVVYYSTGYLLDGDYNDVVSGANAKLFGESASYLCKAGEISAAVPAKNLQVTNLMITDRQANIWAVLCVFVIPAAFLTAGVWIWAKRRRR